MMKYGFIKVASAVPMVKVGDVKYNVEQIENLTVQAEGKGVEVIVFPELSSQVTVVRTSSARTSSWRWQSRA